MTLGPTLGSRAPWSRLHSLFSQTEDLQRLGRSAVGAADVSVPPTPVVHPPDSACRMWFSKCVPGNSS